MAFKRSSFSKLVSTKRANFAYDYRFSKKANFKIGSDAYVIPLGLEDGYYETPCHTVRTHTVDKKTIGFNGSPYAVYVKCEGYDEEGNKSESLCCTLAQMEKDRLPDQNDSGKRIVTFMSTRVHLPVLILGNSVGDDSKISYPISKVSILNDLKSEVGLKFAYIDMASSSFKSEILSAYGKKLKEDGILEYDLAEDSEEYYETIREYLTHTIIKVHGVQKQGFQAAMKEYSFFPFDNAAIAKNSPEGEREAIVNYKENKEIMAKVTNFLTLFNIEVDNLVQSWNEKDLKEYYNSAIGADLKAPIKKEDEEKIEIIDEPTVDLDNLSKEDEALLDTSSEDSWEDEMDSIDKEPVETKAEHEDLDDFEFDSEDEESFFAD